MPEDHYKPIACGDYDIYEIAIMKKRKLMLEYISAGNVIQKDKVTPLELKIIDSAEYLLFEITDKKSQKITEKVRLDKIKSATIF